LLILQDLDAFAETKCIGVTLRDGGDAAIDGAGFETDVLNGEEIGEDAEDVNAGDREEAAHPDAIDELLAIADGEFGRQ
jgi:hypothetical protein